jgi:hypothetical protein
MAERRRHRYLLFGLVECGLALLALAAVAAPRPDPPAGPERVSAHVRTCDLRAGSSAQITYTVTNSDQVRHTYQVELLVANATAPFGAGVSLTGHIPPGSTVTARALVPLTEAPTGADCKVRAKVYDGQSGHHG